MVAAFWWEEPACVGAALVLASAAAAYLRLRRQLAPRFSGPAASEAGTVALFTGGGRRVWRVMVPAGGAALAGAAAGLIAWWLVHLGTSAALGLLGVLAAAGLGWLALRVYGRPGAQASVGVGAILGALRWFAAALVLLLVGRPVWDWEVVEWQKPLLVALLDQSASMGIADLPEPESGRSRAEAANAAFDLARSAIRRLDASYEVRLRGVGDSGIAVTDWLIEPRAPVSPLAAAVREAGRMRSRYGATPLAVLLVSDGAENVEPGAALRQAAAELAAQGTGLLAVGVGPEPGRTPSVVFEPLVLPAQMGLRDWLRLPVTARVQGCAGATINLELLWNLETVASRSIRVDSSAEQVSEEFEIAPPGAGVHRLTARLRLPSSQGGQVFETSVIVDVRDQPIRVLYIESAPRPEVSFVSRALAADPRLRVERRFLAAGQSEAAAGPLDSVLADCDVIIVGQLAARLPSTILESIQRAVAQRGVGVLLAGGRSLFNDQDYAGTALEGISPTLLVADQFGLSGPIRPVPTEAGRRHPALRDLDSSGARSQTTAPVEVVSWHMLPPLSAAARLGRPKPLAEVLLEDDQRHPLLVAHDVGRGRCIAAAWESTWAWALASDASAEWHRSLWRQLVLWLANRRPRAWVLTDQPTYTLPALSSGQARIRVRAGISGAEFSSEVVDASAAEARLELIRAGVRQPVALTRRGQEWFAELPEPGGDAAIDQPGSYALEFTVRGVEVSAPAGGSAQGDMAGVLLACTAFEVAPADLELRPPTANLGLLRAAAEAAEERGGGYCRVDELPELLDRLASTDCRQEVRHRQSYRMVEQEPWALWAALVVLLSLEWGIRKRVGLA